MDKNIINDPFENARKASGYHKIKDQNDPVTMILGHKDVRRCAHNWKTFQSGAKPGRIVVPSEVNIRETRQIPFEVDPPDHKEYRAIVEDWFRRPLHESYTNQLQEQIDTLLDEVLSKDTVDVVSEFALVLQSQALTLLLNMPFSASQKWISWGTHVFRSEDSDLDADKANILYNYIDQQIERAEAQPSDDLFSVLLASEFQGRKLTKEEVKGVMVLTFAGGRDTVINYITNTIAYLASNPAALLQLSQNPDIHDKAVEELVRYFSPLTHMGRVATEDTKVCEHAVKADSRISLCWASANRDAAVFENPNEIVLDRSINPHVAFGFGVHKCLGATHARQIMKVLLSSISKKIKRIEILNSKENIEEWGRIKRKVGYNQLSVNFYPKS